MLTITSTNYNPVGYLQSITIQSKDIFSGNLQIRYWLVANKIIPKQKRIFEFFEFITTDLC